MAQIHKCLVFLLVLSPCPIFPVFPFHLWVWEIPWKALGLRPGPGDPGVLVNSVCPTVHSPLCAVPEAVLSGPGSRLLPSPAHSGLRLVTASGFCTILDGPLHLPSPLSTGPSKNTFHLNLFKSPTCLLLDP